MQSRLRRSPIRPEGTGFTLIELLAVVAIIALLIGVLLPALGSARRAALVVQDLANLRMLGVAQHAYATDYDGQLVDYALIEGGGFTGGEELSWVRALRRYRENITAQSPLDRSPHWSVEHGGTGAKIGGRLRVSSYGINEFLTPSGRASAATNGAIQDNLWRNGDSPARLVQFTIMAFTGDFAVADHYHASAWAKPPFFPGDEPAFAAALAGEQIQIDAVDGPPGTAHARSNFAFLDAHASTHRFDEVYPSVQQNHFEPITVRVR